MTNLPVVYYAQGLAGKRWRYYAPWSGLLPSTFMDKWAARWPARRLWQGTITCGPQAVALEIYGGSLKVLDWYTRLSASGASQIVASANLSLAASGSSLPPGRLLLATHLRQALVEIGQQRQLLHDRLSVGLVANGQEMSCWLANIEGLARQVTVVTDRRSRLLPIATSGLAPRQLDRSVATLGVDILIVAPEFLPWLADKVLTPGTVVVRTDGGAVALEPGVMSISLNLGELFLPTDFLARVEDLAPLSEAIILAAYFIGQPLVWPTSWSKRLTLVQRAVEVSGWQLSWRLVGESSVASSF